MKSTNSYKVTVEHSDSLAKINYNLHISTTCAANTLSTSLLLHVMLFYMYYNKTLNNQT